jgi:hypothetical protein
LSSAEIKGLESSRRKERRCSREGEGRLKYEASTSEETRTILEARFLGGKVSRDKVRRGQLMSLLAFLLRAGTLAVPQTFIGMVDIWPLWERPT